MIENFNPKTGEIVTFNTRYSFERVPGENYTGIESQTDVTQYVPTKTLIKSIVRGDTSRLVHTLINMQADDFDDPTTIPGYDLADAFEDLQQAQDNLLAEKKAQESNKTESATPVADTSTEATTNENKE